MIYNNLPTLFYPSSTRVPRDHTGTAVSASVIFVIDCRAMDAHFLEPIIVKTF